MNKFERRSNLSYNKKADNYDSTYDGKFTVKFKKLLCDAVKIDENATVADIGCGNGRLLHSLAEKYSFYGYGIDISERMIECARQTNPDMKFYVAKCDSLPLESNTVDVMTVCAAFHHFPDAKAFAKEAARVLKIGGVIYIADVYLCAVLRAIVNPFIKLSPSGDVKIYAPKQIARLFKSYGFILSDIKVDGKVQLVTLKKQ